MKYLKIRGISMLLAAAMVFTALPSLHVYAEETNEKPVIAEEPPVQKEPAPENIAAPEEKTLSVRRLVKKGEPSESGYQEMVWVDENGNEVEGEDVCETSAQARRRARISFPSSYSMENQGELPAVRNQGKWGTCWAHAAMCSIETNMIKKGLVSAADADYSERHLSYFVHRRDETQGDGEDSYHDTYGWYGGGNYYMAAATLANWYGAAVEKDYPYASYSAMDDLTEADRTASAVHLTDVNRLNTPEDVKQAVMNTGSVMCSFYSGDGTVNTAQGKVYHAEEHATDHAVSIVGWDDNYSRTNFDDNGRKPANDGAWRCRNSWGANWAENGYFWISYEDATLKNFCSYEAEMADDYDNIHAYDGSVIYTGYSYKKAANIFCAQSAEELRAVAFHAYGNYDYRIEIYAAADGTMALPTDGTLVCSQEGKLSYAGYHVIPLEETVLLSAGTKYAVSMEWKVKDGETAYTYVEMGDTYSAKTGQSFFYTGTRWLDATEKDDCKNVTIKALTDNVDSVDKSRLQSLIEEAEQLVESDYAPVPWEDLQTALGKAREVYQSLGASEDEVILAVTNLQAVLLRLTKPETFTITYHLNGGTGKEEDTYNEHLRVILPVPVKEGAQFLGWYDNEQLQGDPVSEISQGSTGNKKFWAKWDRINIQTTDELEAFSRAVYNGNDCEGQTVYLLNDLDMTGVSHRAIGKHDIPFMGTFEGGGHTISNLEYEYSYSYGGVFGYIGEKGVVRNLRVENAEMIQRASWTGGMVGLNEGTISNCSIQGTFLFDKDGGTMGGFAGNNKGTIEHSFLDGAVTFHGQQDSDNYVGGLVGDNSGSILKCYVKGEIVSDGAASIGGITGCSRDGSEVKYCYNLASIGGEPSGDARTAGIGVFLFGTTGSCYNFGEISQPAGNECGAVYVYCRSGSVSNCYYLDTSSAKGGYSPSFSSGSMTAEDFEAAKTAYWLNSNGGTGTNTYEWSQKDGIPVWTDSENKAVIKVLVSQAEETAYAASINGITAGEFYAKGGTEVEFRVPAAEDGYRVSASVAGLVQSDRGDNWYVLPEADARAVITCTKTPVTYDITYHLNRGNGEEAGTYDVETAVTLPTPQKAKAQFLGWYDNASFTGEAVSAIPLGSTGNKEFWAKWQHLGYEVIFPQKKGYEAAPAAGYVNGKIPEDGSYLFTLSAKKGYDLSEVTVKYGDTVLKPSDGVYRIDHILSDIENLSVEGIRLGDGNYVIESRNGYVGETMVIRPVLPATGIAVQENGYSFRESVTLNTDTDSLYILTCDEEGTVSRPQKPVFNKDVAAPVITSVDISAEDGKRHYKGVYLTVHAEDAQSGVAEYSFDGGKNWQENNQYYVACGETAKLYDKKIQVRDAIGNTAEYAEEIMIPAFVKYTSSITLDSGKAEYEYGEDIILKAGITFENAEEDTSGYGKVTFVDGDGKTLGTAGVEVSGKTEGSAEITVPAVLYDEIGEKTFQAVYNGAGTLYEDSTSGTEHVRICKARAAGIRTNVPDLKIVSAAEQYTAEQLIGQIGMPEVTVYSNYGITRTLPVTWRTENVYQAKGGTYEYIGTISDDAYMEVPENLKIYRTVRVTPVIMENPVLEEISVEQDDNRAADAGFLGSGVLPVSGSVSVGNLEIPYQIRWNESDTIDLTAAGSESEFTGRITYENVPEWVTLPEDLTVSRRVRVKGVEKTQAVIAGVQAQDGTYNGHIWNGYTGTPDSEYKGNYEIFYSGRGVTVYNSSDAPKNAGTYTVTIRVPENDERYTGSRSLDFEIAKAEVEITVRSKNVKAGSPVPEFTDADYTVSGLAEGEELKVLPELSYADEPDMTNAGSVMITAGGARVPDGGNYCEDIRYVNGMLNITKHNSSITITPETESYLYGEEIVLVADIRFENEAAGNTSYGKVQFFTSDHELIGSRPVEHSESGIGCAKITVPASIYKNAGSKFFYAAYDGTGTPYDAGISGDCCVNIEKRAVENPVLKDIEIMCGEDISAGAEVLPESGVLTVCGEEISYRITWISSEAIDLTTDGTTVEFTGTIIYENVPEWLELPENLTVKRRVTVKRTADLPQVSEPETVPQTPGKTLIQQPDEPAVEDGMEVEMGFCCYRILNSRKKTAALAAITDKNITKMNVPATVVIGGTAYKVVQIGAGAFQGCKKLKKLILGKNITTIGKEAFINCRELKTIQLKGSALKTIKQGAFKKTAAKITVDAKKMTKKQKDMLGKKLKKAGISKRVRVK